MRKDYLNQSSTHLLFNAFIIFIFKVLNFCLHDITSSVFTWKVSRLLKHFHFGEKQKKIDNRIIKFPSFANSTNKKRILLAASANIIRKENQWKKKKKKWPKKFWVRDIFKDKILGEYSSLPQEPREKDHEFHSR